MPVIEFHHLRRILNNGLKPVVKLALYFAGLVSVEIKVRED